MSEVKYFDLGYYAFRILAYKIQVVEYIFNSFKWRLKKYLLESSFHSF